jgi:MipA family protein
MIRTLLAATASCLFFTALPAAAQDQPAAEDNRIIVSFGVGPQMLPQYPGADSYRLAPLFGGHVRRVGDPIPVSAPDDGFGISLTGRSGPIEIGPMVQFQSERKQSEVGAAVGDVDFTVEPGAFVNVKLGESFRIRAEARHGVGGHESWVGDLGLDFVARPNIDTMFTIGPRLRLADSDYMRTYFGVTPAAAAASGLAAYAPDGGVRAVGAIAGITRQLGRSFGVFAYAGYDRLVGDAADSPIVRQLGSRDQFSGGIALYFSFRMRNPF